MSLKRLARRIRKLGDEVVEGGIRRRRQVAIAIDQPLVSSTPVDTGAARSNWLVGLGAPRRETIPPLANGESATQPSVQAATSLIKSSNAPEQPIYISNNLPYIRRLNDGYSAQAPANFVQIAVLQGVNTASRLPFLKR